MSVAVSGTINKHISLDEAFEYCAKVTNAHYENFPVASLFLPQEKRPYIQAIYAFSRYADDIADEGTKLPEDRLSELDEWQAQLDQCHQGKAEHPVFIALGETIRKLDLPVEPLNKLLIAFRRDVSQQRYPTFEDLLSYCECSANPIGRLVLMVFGYRDEALLQLSDRICTALQLTNFWQDIALDQLKNRLYLPLEDCGRFGYAIDQWEKNIVDPSFRSLMKFQVDRTRAMFYDGAELPARVERDLRLELKLVWFGGMRILKKLDEIEYDVYTRRPRLTTADKFMIFVRGLMLNDLPRFGKKRQLWDLT